MFNPNDAAIRNPNLEIRNPKQIQTRNDQNDRQRKEFVRRSDYREAVKQQSPASRSAGWVAESQFALTPKALHNEIHHRSHRSHRILARSANPH
jgi:hypothetical protein